MESRKQWLWIRLSKQLLSKFTISPALCGWLTFALLVAPALQTIAWLPLCTLLALNLITFSVLSCHNVCCCILSMKACKLFYVDELLTFNISVYVNELLTFIVSIAALNKFTAHAFISASCKEGVSTLNPEKTRIEQKNQCVYHSLKVSLLRGLIYCPYQVLCVCENDQHEESSDCNSPSDGPGIITPCCSSVGFSGRAGWWNSYCYYRGRYAHQCGLWANCLSLQKWYYTVFPESGSVKKNEKCYPTLDRTSDSCIKCTRFVYVRT